MPRRQAGYKYPHATTSARTHDHSLCLVVQAVADRAAAGTEPWGTLHPLPAVPDEATARKLRIRFFTVKKCKKLEQRYGEPVSVRCEYQLTPAGYILAIQVWPRSAARAEITRRVTGGESLPFNPYREKQ